MNCRMSYNIETSFNIHTETVGIVKNKEWYFQPYMIHDIYKGLSIDWVF